jgi:LytS/YehU family sensor histidine kinase
VTITVSAGVEREQLILSVENDGAHAAAPAQRGVGLNHVARRLHLLYGDAARLDARPRGSGGFEARIGLPERS